MTLPPSRLPISTLILAGGQGRRMAGRDKGLVAFSDLPMIEHALRIAGPWCDDLIISCNRNLEIYGQYTPRLVQDEQNDYPGPLAGILAGLERARETNLLVLPCDTPLLPEDLPGRLYQAHLEHPQAITLVDDGERLQPLHAIIPVHLKEDLRDFMASGRRAVMGWYDRHPLNTVDFSDVRHRMANINRPEELQNLEK